MKRYIIALLVVAVFSVLGCKDKPSVTAELSVDTNPQAKNVWQLEERLSQTGEENTARVVSSASLGANHALELAAGGQGDLQYSVTGNYAETGNMDLRLRFLSTQGTATVKLEYVDEKGDVIAVAGWVFTGALPASSQLEKWFDARTPNNYTGNWITFHDHVADIIEKNFPAIQTQQIQKVRLSVSVGQGQHCLITNFALLTSHDRAVAVKAEQTSFTMRRGQTADVNVKVTNKTAVVLRKITLNIVEPYGYGVAVVSPMPVVIDEMRPGEEKVFSFKLTAHRPDEVNLNKPWQVGFNIDGAQPAANVAVSVSDDRPGKVFYVMTEDLEPIDSAGYMKKWGNANGWLDSEEIILDMVDKAERLNAIADKYDARWTHYIAWPVIRACDWLSDRQKNSSLGSAAAKVKKSVAQQAADGHEYALHMHSDYDPYLPGNFLSYNDQLDGFWANHLNHGWAHAILEEGTPEQYATRQGIIYSYKAELDYLVRKSGQGQIVTARAGSFDFGNGSEDEAKSIRVYQRSGIYGGSDADGNSGGIISAAYGKEIYLTSHDDINRQMSDSRRPGIVQFRPTPVAPIMYDGQSDLIWNDKVNQGMMLFAAPEGIKPGVHAIIGFTHAMFVMGRDDYKSLDGGNFDALDRHLAFIKRTYVDNGQLSFATASQLVKEYLDYYSPTLMAVYGKSQENVAYSEYEVILLGRDIPADDNHRQLVSIKYPLYLRDSAYRIEILKNGQKIYTTWGLPTPFNDICFMVNDPAAKYTMKIYHNKYMLQFLSFLRGLRY